MSVVAATHPHSDVSTQSGDAIELLLFATPLVLHAGCQACGAKLCRGVTAVWRALRQLFSAKLWSVTLVLIVMWVSVQLCAACFISDSCQVNSTCRTLTRTGALTAQIGRFCPLGSRLRLETLVVQPVVGHGMPWALALYAGVLLVLQVVAAFVYYGLVQLVPQLEFVAGESKQCLQNHLKVPVSLTAAAVCCYMWWYAFCFRPVL